MGGLLRVETLKAPKAQVKKVLEDIIKEEDSSRFFESDMYRGDFGSSSVRSNPVFQDKTKSPNKQDKNFLKFNNEQFGTFEKYIIDYALIGLEGYIAYEQPKAVMQSKVNLNKDEYYRIKYIEQNSNMIFPQKTILATFNNKSSMNKFLRDLNRVESTKYINTLIDKYNPKKQTSTDVGEVLSKTRLYKNKPNVLPKKYIKLDEFVNVAYGGICPY